MARGQQEGFEQQSQMKSTLSKWIYNIAGMSKGPVEAALIYFLLSLYLHLPYLKYFSRIELLLVAIPPIGALGCFILSTRYAKTFSASILAGAIYAFCPFTLAFSAYHRFAGIPAAMAPWLFIPAVYISLPKNLSSYSNAVKAGLAILGALTIGLFFYLLSLESIGPFFPMPLVKTQLSNLAGISLPLTGNAQDFVFSFYHLPLCAAVLGLLVYICKGSFALIVVGSAAFGLTFCGPFMETPPIAWGLLTVICCSILAAVGAEGIVSAKKANAKWMFVSLLVSAVLSVFAFTNGQLLSGGIFAAAAFFLAATIMALRKSADCQFALWTVFYISCCADILWGAKYTLEQIFGYGF